MNDGIKLNVGASPIWEKDGWHTLDHKVRLSQAANSLLGEASSIPLDNETCSTIFCSHMFEHIPHVELENVLLEFNRVLAKDGIVRILTPNLKKIAEAYVKNDVNFFASLKKEDVSIRTDLGLGGMFVNFIISPGQDTALFSKDLKRFIAGYAHIYCYDFDMLRILLERTGFGNIKEKSFCDSELLDYNEPLHVQGHPAVWQDFNHEFYIKNNLVHYYDSETGGYVINFKLTGFDRDPLTSLIVEARKISLIDKAGYKSLNNEDRNYNRYAFSLLQDHIFAQKLSDIQKLSLKW